VTATLLAFRSSYHNSSGRLAGQVKLVHILRPDRRQGFCGAAAWDTTHSPRVPVDSQGWAEDLAWCPHCLGRAAKALGILDAVAHLVVPHILSELP
jgi:hypothetical protein